MNRFWIKLINLLLVVGAVLGYNAVQENRAQAEEVARLNAQMESMRIYQATESETEEATVYEDGVYEGSAKGYGGMITVSLTVERDVIKKIDITSAPDEDHAYLEMASAVVKSMLKQQTTDVDTVSGATFSSTGIINAAKQALESARKNGDKT